MFWLFSAFDQQIHLLLHTESRIISIHRTVNACRLGEIIDARKWRLRKKSMLKKIAWFGLMFIMASCAGGKIQTAQADDHVKSTSLPVEATVTVMPTTSPTLIEPTSMKDLPVKPSQAIDNSVEPQPGIEITSLDKAQPAPEDSKMKEGKVFIDSVDFDNGMVIISGNLPTPCHILRTKISDREYADQLIDLSVYSLWDEDSICIQSLAPFKLIIPLELTQPGEYSVVINNENRFKFNWPEIK